MNTAEQLHKVYLDSGLGFQRDLLDLGDAGCWAFTTGEVAIGKLGVDVIVSYFNLYYILII